MSFRISGTGCSLLDSLYTRIDFNSPAFRAYLSQKAGDGGLVPGKLTFAEHLSSLAGKPYAAIREEITGGRAPDSENLGGPAIVAIIHAAQMLRGYDIGIEYYGFKGKDSVSTKIENIISRTPVGIRHYTDIDGSTPITDVYSDPAYNNGQGERSFVNQLGVAWDYGPEDIHPEFFETDMTVFGGTALVPRLHEGLGALLERAKSRGCITVVNTVFDFRNEQNSPGKQWPLGDGKQSLSLIDLLIMDNEEALKLSGKPDKYAAMNYFAKNGTDTVIITHGSLPVVCRSSGGLFREAMPTELPVSERVTRDLEVHGFPGDTTGCGDNFVGGVIASLVAQLEEPDTGSRPDLLRAACWGIVSGGFTCFYAGGTFIEREEGEKRRRISEYYREYIRQIASIVPLPDSL